jgi:hypothetical protein
VCGMFSARMSEVKQVPLAEERRKSVAGVF